MRAPWERAGEEEALCVSQRNKEKRERGGEREKEKGKKKEK